MLYYAVLYYIILHYINSAVIYDIDYIIQLYCNILD